MTLPVELKNTREEDVSIILYGTEDAEVLTATTIDDAVREALDTSYDDYEGEELEIKGKLKIAVVGLKELSNEWCWEDAMKADFTLKQLGELK